MLNLPNDDCCLTFNDGVSNRIICLSIDSQADCPKYTNNWKNLINGMIKRSKLLDDYYILLKYLKNNKPGECK